MTGTPSVVVHPGHRMRVFATDANGNVVTTAQSAEGGAYRTWDPVAGITAQGSPSAARQVDIPSTSYYSWPIGAIVHLQDPY
jgi:hypothetical protein